MKMKRLVQIIMILPVLWIPNAMASGGFGEPGAGALSNSLVLVGNAIITRSETDPLYALISFNGVCRGETVGVVADLAPGIVGDGALGFADLTKDDFLDAFISGDLYAAGVLGGHCDIEGATIDGLRIKNIGKFEYEVDMNGDESYKAIGVIMNPWVR